MRMFWVGLTQENDPAFSCGSGRSGDSFLSGASPMRVYRDRGRLEAHPDSQH